MPVPLFATAPSLLWHAIPIILIVSLVYGATRHELLGPILHHAFRTAVWISGFMLMIGGILWVVARLV